MIKKNLVRGIRKSAHISRRVLSVGANYSGRVENKAHRIINGMDDAIKLEDKVLFEKLYYESIPYITPIHPALPRSNRSARVTILIPSLQKSSFFGGTATALFFAAICAEKAGMPLLIAETLKKGRVEEAEIRKFYKDNNIGFKQKIEFSDLSPRKYNNYGYIDLHPDDIFICSAWWDAYLLEQLPLTQKFIYLIQDYEPIFYNNSDLQVLAESTYHSEKFIPVCNTKFMLEFMASKGYTYIEQEGIYFEPAVNIGKRIGVASATSAPGTKRIFVYGRPSVERNLFYTALKALDELFTEQALNPAEWECFMAGQDGISNILLESGKVINNLGKMDVRDYYEFAKTIDLGVSLMLAPHPSYPPLELSSLGSAVVSTKYETKQDLKRYNDNLFLCDASVSAIKQSILEAVRLDKATRIRNAKATNLESDWTKALEHSISTLLKRSTSIASK